VAASGVQGDEAVFETVDLTREDLILVLHCNYTSMDTKLQSCVSSAFYC